MGDYELGRDLQDLRSRIERLESDHDHHNHRGGPERSPFAPWAPGRERHLDFRASGHVPYHPEAGVHPEKKPVAWKLDRNTTLPPGFLGLLGAGPHAKFDLVESQTWSCYPEPLIQYVIWDAGGTDEYYRLSNQTFSIFRYTDPNNGVVTATASYSALLIAGKGYTADQFPNYFNCTLRNAGGTGIDAYYQSFRVECGDNYPVTFMGNFQPGLYEAVTGATWQLWGGRVGRC